MIRKIARGFAPLVAGVLVAAVAEAGATTQDYSVSGSESGGGALSGEVRFAIGSPTMLASFDLDVGGSRAFHGEYEELNLLFISFWSFDGDASLAAPGSDPAFGSGIRLLFGLFVIGSFDAGPTYSFAGTFSGTSVADRLAVSPADGEEAELSASARAPLPPAADRRTWRDARRSPPRI